MILGEPLKISIVAAGIFSILSIGYFFGYSFSYFMDKKFGGKNMKNDVVDSGERVGFVSKMIKGRQPKVQEPQQAEYIQEQPMQVQQQPQRQEIEIDALFQNMVSDLKTISEHLETMASSLDYIRGYLKGKGMI